MKVERINQPYTWDENNVYAVGCTELVYSFVFFLFSGESLLAASLSSFSHDSKGPHVHLGKAHLREAILLHEDALRLHSLCKLTRKIDTLQVHCIFYEKVSCHAFTFSA